MIDVMAIQHQTVSQVIGQIKVSLEGQFRRISVVAEVSNLSRSGAGHCYFTLSDSQSSLSSVLFRGDALRNPIVQRLKDGDQVFCQGSISVYAKRGQFQLIVKTMAPAGKGQLLEQLETLKRKLRNEGLFEIEHKQKIPLYPKRVAVITAQSGAALQDFLNIFHRRSLWMDVVLVPATVQGKESPQSLRKALAKAIKYSLSEQAFDVIVLTRGGGSLEDLWAFNDEGLAWDIYNCPVPVISAVGHEVDTSVSDLVADLRCETPSAAAEVLTRGQVELTQRISKVRSSLFSRINSVQKQILEKKKYLSPKNLTLLMRSRWQEEQRRLAELNLLERSEELVGIHDRQQQLDENSDRMERSLENIYRNKKHKVLTLNEKLKLLDPENVLQRGYSYVQDESGQVVKNSAQFKKLKSEEVLSLRFSDGQGFVTKRST
jgi:exodeoxyribonuclease VII large subunit